MVDIQINPKVTIAKKLSSNNVKFLSSEQLRENRKS